MSSGDTASEEAITKPVPSTTAWRRKQGMPDIDQKAIKQGYLTAEDKHILLVDTARFLDTNSASISEQVRNRAFEIKRQRLRTLGLDQTAQELKPPGKMWACRLKSPRIVIGNGNHYFWEITSQIL
jgi:hypothetical protein